MPVHPSPPPPTSADFSMGQSNMQVIGRCASGWIPSGVLGSEFQLSLSPGLWAELHDSLFLPLGCPSKQQPGSTRCQKLVSHLCLLPRPLLPPSASPASLF